MSSQGDLVHRIRVLSDAEAVRALAALVEDHGLLPAAEQLPGGAELRGSVDAGDLEAYPRPGGEIVTDGELARTALECVATAHPESAGTVGEAVEYAQSPMDRLDPVTIPVAALVITLLQTEVVVKREEHGRWSLTIHKRALRDSALGRVLTALLSQITGGK